jgi:hypothetical protein
MRPLCILLTLVSLTAFGQDTNGFHAYASTVDLIEGGRVSVVVADWGTQRYSIRCPVGFASHVDNVQRMIKFDTKNGAVAINISLSTNSPGDLPAPDALKSLALARHPGAWFLQSFSFPTSYKPGLYFDLAQIPAANTSLRTRHGFVPTPKGMAEFVFSANDADFESLRVSCMQALGTFTVETIKPKEGDQ